MKTSTTSALFRSAALVLVASALAVGCNKKDDEPEPSESAEPAAEAPIEVAAVPVVQDGVFRYDNEIVTSGKATVSELTQVYKGAEEGSEKITSLDKDLEVEKKARRGDWVLVTWTATEGQPSFGWAPGKLVADKPEIQPPTTVASADAGTSLDAGKASADAGSADAGGADAKDANAKVVDAGSTDSKNAKVDPTATEDAGKAEVAADDAGTGTSDGGAGAVKLPLNKRIPILKLPVKRDKAD